MNDDFDDDDRDPNQVADGTAHDVLEYIIGQIVEHPDDIEIDTIDRSDEVLFEVRVADGDMGRVIGRRGRTADAIRTVVSAAAVADDVDVEVDFVD